MNRRNKAHTEIAGVKVYLSNDSQKKQGKFRVRLSRGNYYFSNSIDAIRKGIKSGKIVQVVTPHNK